MRDPHQEHLPRCAIPALPAPLRQKGEAKAIFAVAHTMLVIVWHVLAQQMPYTDLGVDYYTQRTNTQGHARRLARQIEKLGYRVNMEPAQAA